MKHDVKVRHDAGCCCPVCLGLAAFDRPLWAPGQILTAADLTALQAYVKGKSRLQNRFLHGSGVVCGLEVVCDDCEGYVTIRPGYAIDPCGEDIVVAKDTRFNVIAAIRACADAGRAKVGPCDPWQPPPDPGCREAETHWCIALRYKEVEAAYVRALPVAQPPKACGCGRCSGDGEGCACGGGGDDGACGCGGTRAQPGPAAGRTRWAASAALRPSTDACVPRRVLECFDIGVIEAPHGCVPQFRWPREGEGAGVATSYAAKAPLDLGWFGQFIPEGSLLYRVLLCVVDMLRVFDARFDADERQVLIALFQSPAPPDQVDLVRLHALVCRFRQVVMERLARDAHPVRCQMHKAAAEIVLMPPTRDEKPAPYWALAREALVGLLAVYLQLIIDCVCRAFLPPCSADPCDDRVEIACVTVRGDRILRICNHACRRYAGAFPSVVYWMSLVPILPLIGKLLAWLCCQPELLRRNSPLVNDLMPLLDRLDPSGSLRRAVTADDFRLPRHYLGLVHEAAPETFVARVLAGLGQGVAPASLVAVPAAEALGALKAAGIEASRRDLAGADADALRRAMARRPFLRPGAVATVYTEADRVVAIVPETAAPDLVSLRQEIAELRRQVEALSKHT